MNYCFFVFDNGQVITENKANQSWKFKDYYWCSLYINALIYSVGEQNIGMQWQAIADNNHAPTKKNQSINHNYVAMAIKDLQCWQRSTTLHTRSTHTGAKDQYCHLTGPWQPKNWIINNVPIVIRIYLLLYINTSLRLTNYRMW